MDISEMMTLKKRTEIDVLVLLKKFESATGCEVKSIRLTYDTSIGARELSAVRIDASLPDEG